MTNDLPPQYSPPAAQPLSESDDRLWASLANFGNILGFLPSLLIYLILKDRGPLVRREAKEALNWAITVLIALIALVVVGAVFGGLYAALPSGIDAVFSLLGVLVSLLYWAVVIVNVVFSILSGVRVNQGGSARYPFVLRLVK